MRALPLVLLGLLALPSALAGHPVQYDPAALAAEGAEMVVFVDVNGRYRGSAEMSERTGDSLIQYGSAWAATYSWSATAFLEAKPEPDAEGWTHAGRAWANVTLSWDDRGSGKNTHSIGEEYEWSTTAEHTCEGAGVHRMYPNVLARVEGGKVLVRFPDMQWNSASTIRFDCRASDTGSNGEVTEHERVGPGAVVIAPLIDRAQSREEMLHLDLELEPLLGRQTFVGTYSGSGAAPGVRDAAYAYCGTADGSTRRSCTASGTVEATLWVDPCKLVKESFAKHLVDVGALKQPAPGSSEQQVRAFAVDAGQKVRALLGDARQLELMCEGAPGEGMIAVAEATRKVADAWADLLQRGTISADGVREALANERARQLIGAEAGTTDLLAHASAASARLGTATVRVHSPVALHAWDEEGRHVGWNATSGAIDAQVPNATYEGQPGGAQTLVLPAGAFRVTADELGAGAYALNLSGADGAVTPLRSEAGGASTLVLLVDDLGATTLASARGAQPPGFLLPGELRTTDRPASSGAAGGSAGDKGAPLPAWAALAALGAAALAPSRSVSAAGRPRAPAAPGGAPGASRSGSTRGARRARPAPAATIATGRTRRRGGR